MPMKMLPTKHPAIRLSPKHMADILSFILYIKIAQCLQETQHCIFKFEYFENLSSTQYIEENKFSFWGIANITESFS